MYSLGTRQAPTFEYDKPRAGGSSTEQKNDLLVRICKRCERDEKNGPDDLKR